MKHSMKIMVGAVLLVSSPAVAEVSFTGDLTQGGMVQAVVPLGSRVSVDEKPVPVLEDGSLIIGFGRDYAAQALVQITTPDGDTTTQTLAIAPRDYKIQRINGLPKSKVTPSKKKSVQDRILRENGEIARARRVMTEEPMFKTGWQWPVISRISGVYGSQRVLNGKPKRPHFGVDMAAPTGTPILAPADGIIRVVQKNNYYSGGTVIMDHGYRLSSAFLHMHSISAKVGDRVKRGSVIGTVGATGRATGPHLDWRMNWFNQRVDPQLLVGPMPKK